MRDLTGGLGNVDTITIDIDKEISQSKNKNDSEIMN